jgi:hypothetical protein
MKPFPNDFSYSHVVTASSQAIFLCGDLNYRMKSADLQWGFGNVRDHEIPAQKIHDAIINSDVKSLVAMDELTFLRLNQKSMISVFKEAEITFLPSYKLNSDKTYSTKRLPAYCDRILYTTAEHSIKPISYQRVEDYDVSDHDPVVGMYLVEFMGQCEIKTTNYTFIRQRLERVWKINRVLIVAVSAVLVLWISLKNAV